MQTLVHLKALNYALYIIISLTIEVNQVNYAKISYKVKNMIWF